MFSLGVNFVLYKPVAYERALSSLRAARAVMRKEKRKNASATVHTQATIDYANVQQERATLVDLAQDGMQVRFGKKLPPTSKVYFQFKLPQQTSSVRLSGQVVWQDWNGRAGVQFVDVPKASRKLITDFLAASLPSNRSGSILPNVTVEFDEPLQLATISVAEQTHGTPSSHGTTPQESARQDSTKDQATEYQATRRRDKVRSGEGRSRRPSIGVSGGFGRIRCAQPTRRRQPAHSNSLRLPPGRGSLSHRRRGTALLLPDGSKFRGMLP